MGQPGKEEILLIEAGSLDPALSHLSGLSVVSIMMTPREKARLLRKRDGNGHSNHLAFLVKPSETEVMPTGELAFPMVCNMVPGCDKADFGNISNFTSIRVPEKVFRDFCENGKADAALFPKSEKLGPNTCCIVRFRKETALAIYKRAISTFYRVPDPFRIDGKITPLTAELSFASWMLRDDTIQIVALWGKAGTGKSTMALHGAFDQILAGKFNRLLTVKSTQQAKGQVSIAAVPGDAYKKFADQRRPVEDTLYRVRKDFLYLLHQNKKEESQKRGRKPVSLSQGPDFGIPADIIPLNFLRGAEFQRTFMFAEEAQNMTPDNILLLGTRGGKGSKLVVVGDNQQVDHPNFKEDTNGLADMLRKLGHREEFGQVMLTKCLREGMARVFVESY